MVIRFMKINQSAKLEKLTFNVGFFIGEIMNMNKLLADIVVAAGGSVSNPSNRNKLLKDWLTALGG